MGNVITLVGIITLEGNFVTLVEVITSKLFYYSCGSDMVFNFMGPQNSDSKL